MKGRQKVLRLLDELDDLRDLMQRQNLMIATTEIRAEAAEAEVEHWKRMCVTWSEEYAKAWRAGHDVGRASAEAAVERVRAVADEYDRNPDSFHVGPVQAAMVRDLRAAIDGTA